MSQSVQWPPRNINTRVWVFLGLYFRQHTVRSVSGAVGGDRRRAASAPGSGAPAARPGSLRRQAASATGQTRNYQSTQNGQWRRAQAPLLTTPSYKLSDFLNIDYQVFRNYDAIYAEKTLNFGAHHAIEQPLSASCIKLKINTTIYL